MYLLNFVTHILCMSFGHCTSPATKCIRQILLRVRYFGHKNNIVASISVLVCVRVCVCVLHRSIYVHCTVLQPHLLMASCSLGRDSLCIYPKCSCWLHKNRTAWIPDEWNYKVLKIQLFHRHDYLFIYLIFFAVSRCCLLCVCVCVPLASPGPWPGCKLL